MSRTIPDNGCSGQLLKDTMRLLCTFALYIHEPGENWEVVVNGFVLRHALYGIVFNLLKQNEQRISDRWAELISGRHC